MKMSAENVSSPVDSFRIALSDKGVRDLFGQIFDERLKLALAEIAALKEQNAEQQQLNKLNRDLDYAYAKIDELEAYNRRDNIIISGLPLTSFAEAASVAASDESAAAASPSTIEHAAATEKSVLALCQQLRVSVAPSDSSIAHRLPKKGNDTRPPPVIVRFTSRKVRNTVYAARLNLKDLEGPIIYINEDLTQRNAHLFTEARRLRKAKKIYSTWTKSGNVYFKKTETSRPSKVFSVDDLMKKN